MEKEILDLPMGSALLDAVMEKYHFGVEHREAAGPAEERFEEAVRGNAGFWRGVVRSGPLRENGIQLPPMLTAAITLGGKVDKLQQEYVRQGLLLEAYLIEALAGEALLCAYALFNERVDRMTDWHVAKYHFFGSDEYPLTEMPDALAQLSQEEIFCNPACCLKPKKSVVFLAELTDDKNVRCEGVCAGCMRDDCVNRCFVQHTQKDSLRWPDFAGRPLPYGYARIFGAN